MKGPWFIDNRDGNTLGTTIRSYLESLRKSGESPDELCIATSYFNAAGWLQVAQEAERLDKVRLLIGVEPDPSVEIAMRKPGDLREPERTRKQVHEKIGTQISGLKKERDLLFEFNPDAFERIRNLLEFFKSDKVEVRRYEERFFHAKAWILRGNNRGLLAGSSNLTAAGMSRNLELNIGHYDEPVLGDAEKMVRRGVERSRPVRPGRTL